ncbi:ABC transporter substrate-binding protein [Streptomyces albipurpureus]|uniref:ABC transporter substrate-binding protein n=1 Tax=Streptomyces albipurpureus TaxID=2897419 RepID=A0ABT0UPS3_9ACTN|nr:ABC transporter substrate-binding protein [Streptomyces sp. CWNU-1]MCM2390361.1 ABC transporter substrate-binding protein [Streptomyces sp. CWNU-1]
MNRKTLVLPAVVGLLAPVLVACGGAEGAAGGGDAIVVGTTDQLIADAGAAAPLDPAYAYDTGSWNVLRQTVQTLMHAPRGGGDPVPDAASSCSFTDKISQRYRCTLRSGMKFADGTPLTVADVKYSIERVLKINDDNGAAALLANIEAMDIKGDHQIVFHLAEPDATFPYKLSTPVAGIVSKKKYEGGKLRDGFQVDGSGPYTMTAHAKGDAVTRVTFKKNSSYQGDVRLHNSEVQLRIYPDAKEMGKALEDGVIDIATRELAPEQIKKMHEKPKGGIALTELQGLSIFYLAFNTEHPAVKDKAVRQAMAALVDRGQIAGQVYASTAEPLYSLIPASVGSHKNAFYNEYGEPSRVKARQILQKAGIKTPVKLSLHYSKDRYSGTTAKEFGILKEQLNASKLFDATVEGTDWTTFRTAHKRGDYPVFGLGWVPDYPDPDNYIAPFLEKGNFLNSPYVSAEARKLIPQSRRQADRSAAAPAFARLQEIVATDVPVLPLWQGKQYVASRIGVTGVERLLNGSSDLQLWELGRGEQ